MRQLYQYFLTIILTLLSVTSIHAAYCKDCSNCCACNGLENDTCSGVGTSDITDLLGYMYKGDNQILIFGAPYGLYYVWGCNFFWLRGAFGNLFLNTIYGFGLEIPKSNYTEHTYYFIQTTGCPTITVLTPYCKGSIPTTRLSLSTLYKVFGRFNTSDPSCPGPCNLAPASYQYKYPDFFNSLSVGQSSISLFFSSLVSLAYESLNGKTYNDPLKVAKKYGLRVKRGSCPSTYVLQDYPDCVDQRCKNPYQITAEGSALVAQRFNFSVIGESGGLCALSVALGTLNAASTGVSYLLTFTRAILLKDSCDEMFILNVLLQSDSGYLAHQPIWSLC